MATPARPVPESIAPSSLRPEHATSGVRLAARLSQRPTLRVRPSVAECFLVHERATVLPPPPAIEAPRASLRSIAASVAPDANAGGMVARALEERVRVEIACSLRDGEPLSLVLGNLDNLREINDKHGILAGDAVLKYVTALVQSRLRREDLLVRCTGDEIAILLRGTDLARAGRAAERFRGAVSGGVPIFEGRLIPASMSFGCASLACSTQAAASVLVDNARKRLAIAKLRGRNRVAIG
ncbi:MAG: GGDEF domain-containing protein [Byssovorax sp.]